MSGLAIIHGEVLHDRRDEHARAFRYRTCWYVIDMDAIQQLPRRMRWLVGVDRWRPLQLRTATHLQHDDGNTLRDRLDACLVRLGRPPADGPVLLVANLAVFGYVFNPVSWWCCHDVHGVLHTVVAEVRNTFGESHCYAIPADESRPARAHQNEVRKAFHVSPFLPLDLHYELAATTPPPHSRAGAPTMFSVIVRRALDAPPSFIGMQQGRTRPWTLRQLLWTMIRFPLAPQVVTARIHLQALRLWARRAPLYRKPPFTPGVGSGGNSGRNAP